MTENISGKYAGLKDPGIRSFMIEGEKLYPADAVNFTLAQQRELYNKYAAHFSQPYPSGITVMDFQVGKVPCRKYTPSNISGARLLYLHGGGFILGGIASHDSVCADLAASARTETVAVEYRLAPEHPFPAAFDDCWDVLQEMTKDGSSVVVAGDSAGGNLAAALCIKARDLGLSTIKGQVLIYPGLGGDMTRGSYISQANAPGLTTADVHYYHGIYGGHGSKFASPLVETDYANLPPACLVAACLDPLHDDCLDYATRLHVAGVAAEVREEPLLVHAFLRARYMSQPAAESFKAIAAAIAKFAGA
jgi:acetyl esterase